MAEKSAVREVLEDEKAGRLDFFHARTLAYSIAGELEKLGTLVEEWCEKAKASRSPDIRRPAALRAGVGLWILRRYAEAAEMLDRAADHPDGAYFLGLCRVETAEYDKAIESFKQAAKAGQDGFVCDMAIAEAARRAGNREEALARIRKHQDERDGEAELHYQKARCLEEANDYEAAMSAYERAVELNPQHAGALFRLARLDDLFGNDEQAIDYYEKAAAIPPVHANVLVNLGLLYEDHGQYDKAAQAYRRILATDPRHPKARMYLKDALGSLDMYYDEALEKRRSRTEALLQTPLSDFELSARVRACLERMNIRTLGELARLREEDLDDAKNFGETSLAELRELLHSKGLHFGFGREEAGERGEVLALPGDRNVLGKPIADLELPVRCQKAMRALNVHTVGDLLQKTERELLECPNFGETSLNEVRQKLAEFGLALKTEKPTP